MILSIRKTVKALFIIVPLSLGSTPRSTAQRSTTECPSTAETQFGKRVVAAIPLYEVNTDYAAEVRFGNDCNILQIKVAPKHVWQQVVPQWTEPDSSVSLTENQYREVLSRTNRLKMLGPLIKKSSDTISYVTNSKTHHWDQYEHAFINRVMHCCPSDTPELMFSFSIYFLHKVKGKVTAIKPPELPNGFQISRVKIDDDWYLVSATGLEKAKVGDRVALNVAGPVN
jgi:hypothetical protein